MLYTILQYTRFSGKKYYIETRKKQDFMGIFSRVSISNFVVNIEHIRTCKTLFYHLLESSKNYTTEFERFYNDLANISYFIV